MDKITAYLKKQPLQALYNLDGHIETALSSLKQVYISPGYRVNFNIPLFANVKLNDTEIRNIINEIMKNNKKYITITPGIINGFKTGQFYITPPSPQIIQELRDNLPKLAKSLLGGQVPIKNNLDPENELSAIANTLEMDKYLVIKHLLPALSVNKGLEALANSTKKSFLESFSKKILKIIDENEKLATDPNLAKNVYTQVAKSLEAYLKRISQQIKTLIRQKEQTGGRAILKKITSFSPDEVRQIRKAFGNSRFDRTLKGCACKYPSEIQVIQNKLKKK